MFLRRDLIQIKGVIVKILLLREEIKRKAIIINIKKTEKENLNLDLEVLRNISVMDIEKIVINLAHIIEDLKIKREKVLQLPILEIDIEINPENKE